MGCVSERRVSSLCDFWQLIWYEGSARRNRPIVYWGRRRAQPTAMPSLRPKLGSYMSSSFSRGVTFIL